MTQESHEREAALLSERALKCQDHRSFQAELLDLLDRVIGFDKAVLNGYCQGTGEDILSRGYTRPPKLGEGPEYVAELEPQELFAACRAPFVDVDVWSSRRRDQLSLYHSCLRPERVTVFTLTIWRTVNGVFGINLGRTGRGARFRAAEIRAFDRLLPTIKLADALTRQMQRTREPPSFDAWATHTGLGTKERAVAALVVRGFTNPEIAAMLDVSQHTVRNQVVAIFRKAEVTRRQELVFVASTFERPENSAIKMMPWRTQVP